LVDAGDDHRTCASWMTNAARVHMVTFIVLDVANGSLELNRKLQVLLKYSKPVLRAIDASVKNDDPSDLEVSNHHGRICVVRLGAVRSSNFQTRHTVAWRTDDVQTISKPSAFPLPGPPRFCRLFVAGSRRSTVPTISARSVEATGNASITKWDTRSLLQYSPYAKKRCAAAAKQAFGCAMRVSWHQRGARCGRRNSPTSTGKHRNGPPSLHLLLSR
jgi:hypothetical protein